MTKGSTHSCSSVEPRREHEHEDEDDKKNTNVNVNTSANSNSNSNSTLESAFKKLKVDNDNHPRRKSRHPFALKKFHLADSCEQRRSLIHPARLKRITRKESDKTSHAADAPSASGAQPEDNDVTMDELASYFENFVHIPKKMSTMAEMMYT